MFDEKIKKINFGGKELILKTGKIARQASGSIIAQMGDTIVLSTVCISKSSTKDIDFLPLTVNYREMFYAAGKIPGGFVKREGKSSDNETLISRLIDRPIRPLFDEGFFNETQIISTVLSYDSLYSPDILAMISSYCAAKLSGAPVKHILAAAKVGYINKNFVLNPNNEELKSSEIEMIIAGTKSSVMMLECSAQNLNEEIILDAISFGHEKMQPVIDGIEEIVNDLGVKNNEYIINKSDTKNKNKLLDEMLSKHSKEIKSIFQTKAKQEIVSKFFDFQNSLIEKYKENYSESDIYTALENAKYEILRESIISDNKRLDGRDFAEIRPIECETSILPKAHGSALFTRGETQSISVVTLGNVNDEQISDGLDKEIRERFFIHYSFPPYSVNEIASLKQPGRREIGHGKLALKGLNFSIPEKSIFPYTIRANSEITESNGSSSMATVCGISAALMDAGVPIKSHVAGIAMGLIKEKDRFAILSDINGTEDSLGDMDLKFIGTREGVSALQMDTKIDGISIDEIRKTLSQAKEGVSHILNIMSSSIEKPRSEVNESAPKIHTIKINKEKIKDLIGPGGKTIKELCESTGSKIDIAETGAVSIFSPNNLSINEVLSKINIILDGGSLSGPSLNSLEKDSVLECVVSKIIDSGAFVTFEKIKDDGFLHISEISATRINKVEDHLSVGQKISVKVIGKDLKGRTRISLKALSEDYKTIQGVGDNNKDSDKENSQKENFERSNKEKNRNEDHRNRFRFGENQDGENDSNENSKNKDRKSHVESDVSESRSKKNDHDFTKKRNADSSGHNRDKIDKNSGTEKRNADDNKDRNFKVKDREKERENEYSNKSRIRYFD